jgi:hypothetical protein
MEAAGQLPPVQSSLAEGPGLVRAAILERVDRAVDIHQQQLLPFDLQPQLLSNP